MLFISDYDSETKYGNEYMNMHRIEGEMKVRIVYVQKKKIHAFRGVDGKKSGCMT